MGQPNQTEMEPLTEEQATPTWTAGATNGDRYGPAMEITTTEAAAVYWERLVQWTMTQGDCTRRRAEEIERANLLWYAGYYSPATEARVKMLFGPHFPKMAWET